VRGKAWLSVCLGVIASAAVVMSWGRAASPSAGDAVRGERAFQRCYSCHSVTPNEAADLQGPDLYQVVGRRAAAVAGFDYSDAMKAKAAAGLVWDAETLDKYIADPEEVVPGTRMSVPPLRDAQERADIIAYLARSSAARP
jgi:cytochrome c